MNPIHRDFRRTFYQLYRISLNVHINAFNEIFLNYQI